MVCRRTGYELMCITVTYHPVAFHGYKIRKLLAQLNDTFTKFLNRRNHHVVCYGCLLNVWRIYVAYDGGILRNSLAYVKYVCVHNMGKVTKII